MRVFRTNASSLPLGAWAAIAAWFSFAVLQHVERLPAWTTGWCAHVALLALMVAVGPGAFASFTVAAQHVRVDADGIAIERGAWVEWLVVRRVTWKRSPFREEEVEIDETEARIAEGLLRGMKKMPGCALAVLLVVFRNVLFEYVYLPAFAALSPWGSRVIVEVDGREPLVLCDLDQPLAFVRTVRRAILAAHALGGGAARV